MGLDLKLSVYLSGLIAPAVLVEILLASEVTLLGMCPYVGHKST
jgi:hypothetical protein